MANTISDELNRLIQAKAGIKSALEEKGLTIGDSSTLDEFPGLIQEMEVGGSGVDTSTLIDLIGKDIQSLDIPEGTTKIGNNIFYGCHRLRNITIPNTVGLIGAGAFNYCELLNNLIIPNSVGAIGPKVFYQNTNLNDMVILKDTPPTLDSENVFSNSLTIYVKNAAVDAYKNAGGNWNDVSTRINPLASMSYDSQTYTVTALGRGNLELYIDASLCNSSVYTIPQTSEDASHVIMVKSVDPSLGLLDTSTMEVLVRAEAPNYFGLTAIQDASVGLTSTKDGGVDMKYSSDGQNWSTWDYANETLNLPAGETLYFKGDNSTGLATAINKYTNFIISAGQVQAKGNILSLLTDNFEQKNNVPNYCFLFLFKGCTRLISAPELPATIVGYGSYGYMFQGCTSLTTAPDLPATNLISDCYTNMFLGCTNLNYIKAMFTTAPSNQYTDDWVKNISGTGTFVMNSAATWNPENCRGIDGIPSGWTVETAES